MPLVTPDQFDDLLLARRPLLDLRAPVEFARGSIPGAQSLPLLSDEEREQVGICYKRDGQDAAIRLGQELVSGAVRKARMQAWCAWWDANPAGALFCFRGGQRSRFVQRWLAETGRDVPLVEGGYKALRAHLMQRLETLSASASLVVIGGRTGTGKTDLIERLPRSLDLEGAAHHRGSAFGNRVGGQPTPVNFEHRLALDLMTLAAASEAAIAIEDESRNVGRLSVPPTLVANMAQAPLALVEMPLTDRVQVTLDAYVIDACREHQEAAGTEAGFITFADGLRGALDRVRKRLGGERHEALRLRLEQALERHGRLGDTEGHRAWIEPMLQDYYDPMYDYQLKAKLERVAFRGSAAEVLAWVAARTLEPRA